MGITHQYHFDHFSGYGQSKLPHAVALCHAGEASQKQTVHGQATEELRERSVQ